MPVEPDGSVTGTHGADFLTGTDAADTIFGLDGDDSLVGADGADSLVGGAGNDTLRGGHGDDTLLGGDGDDEIEGLYGNDVIDTGTGNDHVFGRDGDDLIYGREGDDHLIGSIGTDTVFGGAGNDTLAGSQGDDEIHGGDGNDLAFIGVLEGSDSIYMDAGNDLVDGASAGFSFYAEGGAGNDTLNSGVGDDTLFGGTGNDVLHGGEGDDTLAGGGDSDVVTGGDGDDVFILQDVPGHLQITDFGANGAADLIDLSQLAGYDTADAVSAVMTIQQGATTLNLDVTGGTLVVTILSQDPLVAEDMGLSGTLSATIIEDTPNDGTDSGGNHSGGDDAVDDGTVEDGPDTGLFRLEGPDAGHFIVDPYTGAISNMDWFTPSYDQVWDTNGDHIYEVSVLGSDASGAEISRSDLELVVTRSGALWREAGADDTPDGGPDDNLHPEGEGTDPAEDGPEDGGTDSGPQFSLEGADASIFDVDQDTGDVSYKQWFTPAFDEVWDMDRDHVYEVSVIGSDASGTQVSRSDLELVVSETDAVWRTATPDSDEAPAESVPEDATAGLQSVDGSGGTHGLLYGLAGQDADIFEIDNATGIVTSKSWFQPSFDEVWDLDRDHIYEISVIGTDEDGGEVGRTDLELVVTESEAVWRQAPVEDVTGEELMALLFTPMTDEDAIPDEPQDAELEIDLI